MRRNNFPRSLRTKVMSCHRQYFDEQTQLMQGNVLSRLTPQLREEVSAFLVSDFVYRCPLFIGVDSTKVQKVVTVMKSATFNPAMDIIKRKTHGRSLLILTHGEAVEHDDT